MKAQYPTLPLHPPRPLAELEKGNRGHRVLDGLGGSDGFYRSGL